MPQVCNFAPFSKSYRFDIFCRVIDNFGDAGVLWRLAQDLASYGQHVRLIIDDVNTLRFLAPGCDTATSTQTVDGITVVLWDKAWETEPCPLEVAEVVIEGFACRIPEDYEEKMSRLSPQPAWLNLDYLSAESWVEDFHALPSPHPRLPLMKTFWFPGFTAKTAGLIIEKDYEARRDAARREAILSSFGADPALTTLFFFVYPYGPIEALAQELAQSPQPLQILLSATESGRLLKAALEKLNAPHLRTIELPFIEQRYFDEILWAVDFAFVRGEDSVARAQLAGTPFIWHIYHQDDNAHEVKLDALTEKLCPSSPNADFARQWEDFQRQFNRGEVLPGVLNTLIENLPTWKAMTQAWSEKLHANGKLAHKVAEFLKNR